jgi:hypothetical protein
MEKVVDLEDNQIVRVRVKTASQELPMDVTPGGQGEIGRPISDCKLSVPHWLL